MGENFVVETDAGSIGGGTSGTGRDVLLLHGGPGLSDYMGMLDGETEGWRRISFQQRGLPPSTTSGPFTPERHAADAAAVLRSETREPAVVVGHSWGGWLSLLVALVAPELVRAVVVIDALGASGDGGLGEMGPELRRRLPEEVRREHEELEARLEGGEESDELALRSLRMLWPGYFATPDSAPPMPADLALRLDCLNGTMAVALEEISSGRFAKSLSALRVPSVVLVGAASPIPVAVGEDIARLCGGELRVVAGAGHFPWVEQPGCVAEALSLYR